MKSTSTFVGSRWTKKEESERGGQKEKEGEKDRKRQIKNPFWTKKREIILSRLINTGYCINVSSPFHEPPSRSVWHLPVYAKTRRAIFRARLFLVIASIVTALALLYNCYGEGIIFPQCNVYRARWMRASAFDERYNKMGIGWPIYHPRNEE